MTDRSPLTVRVPHVGNVRLDPDGTCTPPPLDWPAFTAHRSVPTAQGGEGASERVDAARRLADHVAAHPEHLETAAEVWKRCIVRGVRLDPASSTDVLDMAYAIGTPAVIADACRNDPRPTMIDRYATSEHQQVRVAAAAHHNLTPNLLVRLAGDSDPTVRATIARRRDIPDEVLERLAFNNHLEVAAAARRNLRVTRLAAQARAKRPSPRQPPSRPVRPTDTPPLAPLLRV